MLMCYSMHEESYLMLYCQCNLNLARGCFVHKGVCLVCFYLYERGLCGINVSIHWISEKLSYPEAAVARD